LNTLASNLSQDAQPRDAAMGETAPAPADMVGEGVGEDAEGELERLLDVVAAPEVAVAESPVDVDALAEVVAADVDVLARLEGFSNAVPDCADVPKEAKKGTHDIVAQVARMWDTVRTARPSWELPIQHLAVGALAVYRLRITDIDMHAEVMLLYVVEGRRHARAHNGVFYSYLERGDWDHCQGVVACECLARLKELMRPLEGMFRSFRGTVGRTEPDVLAAIERAVTESGGSVPRAIARFGDVALQAVVTIWERRAPEDRKGGDDAGREADTLQEENLQDGDAKWHVRTAILLAKLSASLCCSLLHTRLFTFFTEWCNTPSEAEPGAAFTDACMKFSDVARDGRFTYLVPKGPEQNIYLYIDHPLRDPVEENASARVKRFYAQTFWGNGLAFECQLAALCLAFRGKNVDRAFWGVGPGGVGQSLFSSHLATLLGRRHAFLHTNVFHTDDELRKQADIMLYSVVIAGQEAVENAAKPMRQRLVGLVGWKRLELNSLLRFTGISEKTLLEHFLQGVVMEYRATFIDEVAFRAAPTDNARHGRFHRDGSLRGFLRFGPPVAATIKILWGFTSEKSGDTRVDLIEACVLRGGYKGLAWASMRLACGLPPRPLPGAPLATEGAAVKSELVTAPVGAVEVRAPFSIVGDARNRLVTLAF